jgi:hypothetical protein
VTIVGRGRLPSDLSGQLMDVLADEPQVVLCDLTGMAAAGPAILAMLDPAVEHVASWPGTLVVVAAPDRSMRAGLEESTRGSDRVLVTESPDLEDGRVLRLLPPLQRARLPLAPQPTAPGTARAFVTQTLQDWDLEHVVEGARLVASELVTNSILHAATVLDFRVSRVLGCVRISVRDHGGGRPSPRPGEEEQPLGGRGLQLVQACARAWGVIPAQARGKTVWAVLDAGNGHPG